MRKTARHLLAGALAICALVPVAAARADAATLRGSGAISAHAPRATSRLSDAAFRQRVSAIVRATSVKRPARGSVAGLLVFRNGRPIYERNADSLMQPASLLKLLTTTAAMIKMGPDFRFVTRFTGTAPDADGVLAGDAVLVGGGDPTFSSAAFAARQFLRDGVSGKVRVFSSAAPTVEGLAAKIASAGVRTITGNLVADESILDASRTQAGWLSSYQHGNIDVGNLSGLTVDLGLANASGTAVAASPAVRAASLLRDALKARGVMVKGTIKMGRAAAGAHEIATISSPPLREIVGWTNRWSINYAAEMLIRGLGARFGGAGTTAAGVAVLRSTLGSQGVDVRGLRMADGSGLSLLDVVRPRAIAQTVRIIMTMSGAAGDAMRSSLPVAGRPGTLLRRMRSGPAAGNLRGKTGLLRGVRAMAGWVRSRDGSVVTYVALFNKVRRPSSMTGVLDFFGTSVAGIAAR